MQQQNPCGRAMVVNAKSDMRLRWVTRGETRGHVARALQLRGPPDTASQAVPVTPRFGSHSGRCVTQRRSMTRVTDSRAHVVLVCPSHAAQSKAVERR